MARGRCKLKLIEKPDEYTCEEMYKELNEIYTRALQLGQTQVALQVCLVKGRLSGAYDPMSVTLPKGRVTGINNGQVEVTITDYKSITNRVGIEEIENETSKIQKSEGEEEV